MRKKFLKFLSFVLFFGTIVFNLISVSAGGGSSKPKAPEFDEHQKYIISRVEYAPGFASDGGKEYYGAWNGANGGRDFNIFVRTYSSMIQNERSARTLKDSEKIFNWHTCADFDAPCKIEVTESYLPGEYILRVDYENKIVYTIRKSGNEYLCTFYLVHVDSSSRSGVKGIVDYHFLISSDSDVIKLLLPIDRELLEQS